MWSSGYRTSYTLNVGAVLKRMVSFRLRLQYPQRKGSNYLVDRRSRGSWNPPERAEYEETLASYRKFKNIFHVGLACHHHHHYHRYCKSWGALTEFVWFHNNNFLGLRQTPFLERYGLGFRASSPSELASPLPNSPPPQKNPALWTATSFDPSPSTLSSLVGPTESSGSQQHTSPGHKRARTTKSVQSSRRCAACSVVVAPAVIFWVPFLLTQ